MILAEDKARLVVGLKQVTKAVTAKNCKRIYLAEDCTSNISDKITAISAGIEVVTVPTMRELGTMCGIDVSASCAAIKLV